MLLIVAAVLLGVAWLNFRGPPLAVGAQDLRQDPGHGPVGRGAPVRGRDHRQPKNLVVLLGAGSIAGQQGLPRGQLALTVALFILIATAPFLAMVGYLALGGTGAAHSLERWRRWLLRDNHLIMAVVLAVLGIVPAAQGASAL